MHSLILLSLVLAGGGSGASVRPVAETPNPYFVVQGKDGSATNDAVLFSKTMSRGGSVLSLDWRQTTPGIDGVGAGNNVFRVSLVVTPEGGAPSTVCAFDVACDAPVGAYTASCTDAVYGAGDSVSITVSRQPCVGVPSGFPAFDIEMR